MQWLRLYRIENNETTEVFLLNDFNLDNIKVGSRIVSFDPFFRSSEIESVQNNDLFAIIKTKNNLYRAEIVSLDEAKGYEEVLPWPQG